MPRRLIRHIARFASRSFACGASLSMLVLFLIIFINSVRRYTLGKSWEWGEELPVFIAIYGVMFGAAWAYMQDRHIRFTMIVGFLSRPWKRRLFILVDAIMAGTGAALTYSGWLFVVKRGGIETSGLISLAKQLRAASGYEFMIWIGHFYPYQAAMVIGGAMLTAAALLKLSLRLLDGDGETSFEW